MTPEELKKLFSYDPETGILRWRKYRHGIRGNRIAGTVNSEGYLMVMLNQKLYRAHRIIWAIVTGEWPAHPIDHEDRNPSNNRWVNLRPATYSQNVANSTLSKANTSGVKGVSLSQRGKWVAKIQVNRKAITLGSYDSKEDAAAAYKRAAEKYFGEYSNPTRLT